MPVLGVLAEHVRGRVVLKRVLAEHGIPFPEPGARMNPQFGEQLRLTPRLAEAVRLASAMEEFTSNPPPALVLLRPAHALPLSAFDWWIATEQGGTNTWEKWLARWDASAETRARIQDVLGGRIAPDAGRAPGTTKEGLVLRLGRLQRLHALEGLRRGRPEAVLEALEALKRIGEDVSSGWFSVSVTEELLREQDRLRLAGVLGTPPDDGFLRRLVPETEPFEIPEAWVRDARRVRDELLKDLLHAPLEDLPVGGEMLGVAEFRDLTSDMDTGSGPGRVFGGLLELLDRAAAPVKEKVLLPIWRFGWGDLAIAEFVLEGDRELERLRQVVAQRSWKLSGEGSEPELGWYRRWVSPYARGAGWGVLLGRIGAACERQTRSGLGAAGIALERYRLRHGEYPERLDQLVPEFLEGVPTDWFCGEPLRYRRDGPLGFRLYGVGRDGEDNGGHESGLGGQGVAVMTGVRFATRGLQGDDLVWPMRGSEEQRRKAMEEQGKRLAERMKNAYGMDPTLMRRYGLVPRTGGTGTFQMSPELARRYGLLPKGASTNAVPSTNAPAAGGK